MRTRAHGLAPLLFAVRRNRYPETVGLAAPRRHSADTSIARLRSRAIAIAVAPLQMFAESGGLRPLAAQSRHLETWRFMRPPPSARQASDGIVTCPLYREASSNASERFGLPFRLFRRDLLECICYINAARPLDHLCNEIPDNGNGDDREHYFIGQRAGQA